MMWILQLSNDTYEWKNVILGVKTYFDASYIFLGGPDVPTPIIYAPAAQAIC